MRRRDPIFGMHISGHHSNGKTHWELKIQKSVIFNRSKVPVKLNP